MSYDNDDEDEENIEKVDVGDSNIVKFIANMSQGQKVQQSTKVDKNILKEKQQALGKLMEQIDAGEDDDSVDEKKNNNTNRYNSNNKNYNSNFNYDNTQDYVPQYSKRKLDNKNLDTIIDNNINNLDNNDDINIEQAKEEIIPSKKKSQVIKREKKSVKNEESNNSLTIHLKTGVKRTVKQKEEIHVNLTYNASFTKGIQREKKGPINIETTDVKDNYTYVSFNKTKAKLPIEKDNSIKIFWYDAIEESFNNKPNVIFFGKIYEPQSKSYLSISIIIKDIYRTVFILPKPEYEEQQQKIYEEFEDLRKKRKLIFIF